MLGLPNHASKIWISWSNFWWTIKTTCSRAKKVISIWLEINSFKNDRNLHLYIDVIMIQSTVNKIGMTSINYWLLLLLLLSRFSGVWLCATPKTAAHQDPWSPGFSRQEYWSGLPFSSPVYESEKSKWSHSVVSDSWRPHGLQPTRLLHPWDLPDKSTGMGCHCLLPITGNVL